MKNYSIFNLFDPYLLYLMLLLSGCSFLDTNNWKIYSPDGNLSVNLYLDNTAGSFFYSSGFEDNDHLNIKKSSLGFETNEENYWKDLKLINVTERENLIDDYTLITGKKSHIRDNYNYVRFELINSSSSNLFIEFKVYDNGFAFRYQIPKANHKPVKLISDKTTFSIPDSGRCWLQPYDLVSKWTPGYERTFTNGSPIGENAPDSSNGWCFPMLFELNNSWLLITEAGLDNNNCAMHIEKDCSGGIYKMAFPVENEAFDVCSQKPDLLLPWSSSWRTVIAGKNLDDIFESNLVTSLSESAVTDETGWIKPGRAAWSWWSESDSPQDYQKQKEYIDFASEMGWEYSLVDANWNNMNGGNIQMLSDYAQSRNVGLLVWYNSGGLHNIVEEEPRDKMHIGKIRRKEFEWLKEIGVKGIKVDFFQSDKKCIINQYHEILSDALDFNLLVNFHGCTMPRGWNRTYPNLLTMEAVKGGEVYKFGSAFPDEAPIMNTVYPFTRNVVGPMDYTPVMFSDHTYPHKTTFSHELATCIVFESGITHFADSYRSYESQPIYVVDFLKNVDVSWDESKLIYGYPGKDIGVARRKNDKWYAAGLNSEGQTKDVVLNMDFLEVGKYKIIVIGDGDSEKEFKYYEKTISNNDSIKINILPFGGYVIEILKINEE